MHATDFFRGYRLLLQPSRDAAQQQERFFPLFFISKSYSLFFGTPSPCHKSDKKRVRNRASVCVLLLVPMLLARVQTVSMCPNSCNTTLEAGDAATRNATVCLFWRSNRKHYYLLLVLVTRALATSAHVRIYLHTEIQ